MKKMTLVLLAMVALIVAPCLGLIAASANAADVDVSELIAGVKRSISQAQKSAGPPHMVIPWVEAEISYVLKKEAGGGVKAYVVTAEGKYATETIQRIKFRIEPLKGADWRVGAQGIFQNATLAGVDQVARKVFISAQEGGKSNLVYPVEVTPDTKIVDESGKKLPLSDVREGVKATIQYKVGAGAEFQAELITIKGFGG